MAEEYDILHKIVVVGNGGVGKSSLVARFTDEGSFTNRKPTVGVEYSSKVIDHSDQKVKIQLWDTAGQERFRALTSQFYRNAKGLILCFDLTERNTFEALDAWVCQVRTKVPHDTPIVLVGLKADLCPDARKVKTIEAKRFVNAHNLFDYVEASSSNGENVEDIFTRMIDILTPDDLAMVQSAPAGKVSVRLEDAMPMQQGAVCGDNGVINLNNCCRF